jgi:hypothetical protein
MKFIFIAESSNEIDRFLMDVNYELKGLRYTLDEKTFNEFWKSNTINNFYDLTNIFIDDYETTVVRGNEELKILLKLVGKRTLFNFHLNKFYKKLADLICLALEKNSGIIFFF